MFDVYLSAEIRDVIACLCAVIFGWSLIGAIILANPKRPWTRQSCGALMAVSFVVAINM